MKGFLYGVLTIVIGYLISQMFSGLGTSIPEMTYVNATTNAVLFLSGVVTFWGYLLYIKK